MATGVVHSYIAAIKRSSRHVQKLPVTPVDVDGVKYLVSTRGESQWVKNVRSDPNVTLTTRFGATRYVGTETPVEYRQPILDAHKVEAGKIVVGCFGKLPDPADHPVFTLTRRPDTRNRVAAVPCRPPTCLRVKFNANTVDIETETWTRDLGSYNEAPSGGVAPTSAAASGRSGAAAAPSPLLLLVGVRRRRRRLLSRCSEN